MDNKIELIKVWEVEGEDFDRATVSTVVGENTYVQDIMLPKDDDQKEEALQKYLNDYVEALQQANG